jgi:serine phosphatase RsbU (regulator of sigma subunit)
VLKRACTLAVESIADHILKDLDEFMDGVPAFDDQTLVVMKVH